MLKKKECGSCNKILPVENFAKNSSRRDGLQSQCRLCKKRTDAKHYRDNKQKQFTRNKNYRLQNQQLANEYKHNIGCAYCKENDPICLDFHHHENNKSFTIGKELGNLSWNNLLIEIKKCKVVCSNCHRKIHSGQKLTER